MGTRLILKSFVNGSELEARQQWPNPFFMEFFMLGAWLI
jgi:hypothetical protein